MYKIEYDVTINEKTYFFSVANESLTILKRNIKRDILDFVKMKKLATGEYSVTAIILYDDEYYDSDDFNLVITEDYADVELVA